MRRNHAMATVRPGLQKHAHCTVPLYLSKSRTVSRFSELPAHLKSTKHSPGFNLTRGLGRHFTTYTVEKILKADSEHASSDFTILDLGSGAGVVGANPFAWHRLQLQLHGASRPEMTCRSCLCCLLHRLQAAIMPHSRRALACYRH